LSKPHQHTILRVSKGVSPKNISAKLTIDKMHTRKRGLFLSEIESRRGQVFCICAYFFTNEVPQKVIDFIYDRTGKPRPLPKEIARFSDPEAKYTLMSDGLKGEMTLLVRRPFAEVKEKIAELKSLKLTPKDKKELALIEKGLKERVKEIERPDEYRGFFQFEMAPVFGIRDSMKLDKMEKLLDNKEVKFALDLIEHNFPKPLHITTCAVYEFEASKFRPVGGFSLPTEIPIPSELKAKFGASELESYGLRFKDSSIGLEFLEFQLKDGDKLTLRLRASYELSLLKDMLRKSYELANEISEFLVREVK